MSEEAHTPHADPTANADVRHFLDQYRDNLSESTLRAKWITSKSEHEDRAGQTLATRDHGAIQQWANERKAQPATVPGTEHDGRPGVLRFDFPDYGGDRLEQLPWEKWFDTFDERKLVFLYQEQKADGHQSNFFHFDSPLREHD